MSKRGASTLAVLDSAGVVARAWVGRADELTTRLIAERAGVGVGLTTWSRRKARAAS